MLSASHEVGWWNGVVVRKEGWVKKAFIVHILALSDFAARDVFCCPRVAELPACVLSVAGAMRTGKSFLLDQMVSLFLALVLMEWSEIFYFRFAALHRAVVQGSLGEAGCRGTPVESTSALRSPLLPFSFPTGFPVSSSSFHFRIYISQPSPATHCGAQR